MNCFARQPELVDSLCRVFCVRMSHDVLENLTDQQYVFAARLIVFHDIAFLMIVGACKTGTSAEYFQPVYL